MKALFCSGSSVSSSALAGSPLKSALILSTSSSTNTGLLAPAFFKPATMRPGSAPTYVRRWPRISASSCTPPSEMRTNCTAGGARDRASERGLADAGRADEAQDRAALVAAELAHGDVLDDALLRLLEPVMIFVEHAAHFGARPGDRSSCLLHGRSAIHST